MDSLLHDISRISQIVLRYFRARTQEVSNELRDFRAKTDRLALLIDGVRHLADEELAAQKLQPIHPRTRTRGSEDSQTTVVSRIATPHISKLSSPSLSMASQHNSVSIQTLVDDNRKRSNGLIQWLDTLKKDSAALGLKGWIRQKILLDTPQKQSFTVDIDENCPVGREVKGGHDAPQEPILSVQPIGRRLDSQEDSDHVLRMSHLVLSTVNRDLGDIEDMLTSVSFASSELCDLFKSDFLLGGAAH